MAVEAEQLAGVDDVWVFASGREPQNDDDIRTIALLGMMHGNEVVGNHVIERFLEWAPHNLTAGRVLLARCNAAAAALGQRHSPEGEDMNRLWDAETLEELAAADPESLNPEQRRVRVLAPHLRVVDLVLDLHSTSSPSEAHLVIRDDVVHARVSDLLGVRRLITGLHEGGILDGGLASTMGLRSGETWAEHHRGRAPRVGITLEAGQHEDPYNVERAWRVVMRLLVGLGFCAGDAPEPSPGSITTYVVQDRVKQSPEGSTPWRFELPSSKLASFERIAVDEMVLRRGANERWRAPAPFTLLMPAPTAAPGADLFYVTSRRRVDVGERPETPEHARVEAGAVERLLDIMSDDEAERGVARVAFDARRILDGCAEVILTTLRLPEDSPHRRLTVIGRDDWGVNESEHRAGQRYRQAVEEAGRAGVPIERVQLLRGATVSHLKRLCSRARPDLTLRFSDRQPHTVAMVVAGDLKLALATGIFRHVRVALVVEAATLHPDGQDVQAQFSRLAIFTSRESMLRVAQDFQRELLRDHHDLLDRLELPGDAVDDDGAIRMKSERQAEVLLRRLLALRAGQWQPLLRRELALPWHVDGDELGAELRRILVRTGILDGEAVRHLLVKPLGQGWLISPAALEDSVQSIEEQLWHLPAPVMRAVPPQVCRAQDVDHNNLARWLGWRRYLQESEVIPGTRGRLLDLLTNADQVQARVTDWYQQAVELAERAPGRVMLVVAGDGLRSAPHREPEGSSIARAHDAAVMCSELHYRRIQHTRGVSLPWVQGFAKQLGQRQAGQGQLSVFWEGEHGCSVNVVLLAVAHDEEVKVSGDSLEGWVVERCAVILSDLGGAAENRYRVGMLTEPSSDGVQVELLAFGRQHCERLMSQATSRASGVGGLSLRRSVEADIQEQLRVWSERVRHGLDLEYAKPETVKQHLGLSDLRLAEALLTATRATPEDSHEVSRQVWASTSSW